MILVNVHVRTYTRLVCTYSKDLLRQEEKERERERERESDYLVNETETGTSKLRFQIKVQNAGVCIEELHVHLRGRNRNKRSAGVAYDVPRYCSFGSSRLVSARDNNHRARAFACKY